jgi:two-component system NtrC family sensor kinase
MKLGTKLILYLLGALIVTMTLHGYLSIQQDKENLTREIRVGMRGFGRALQAILTVLYADEGDLRAVQELADRIGPPGNIHGLVLYDRDGRPVVTSASLRPESRHPDLNPEAVLAIDPGPVLRTGEGTDGYVRGAPQLVYYRIEPIFDSRRELAGAFVLGRQGWGPWQAIERRRNRIVITTTTLALLLSFLVLFIVNRNLTRPVRALIERVRALGEGRWESRIEVSGPEEIRILAREFNQMSERLRAAYEQLVREQEERLKLERDLRRSERLASIGELAAGLAHEVGTPLNIIGGRAEYLLRKPRTPAEIRENLETIRTQIDRVAGIVRQLLQFSRPREPVLREVPLESILALVEDLLRHHLESKEIRLEHRLPAALPPIKGDPDLLQQVFINLFQNSLQALGRGGRIRIAAAAGGGDGEGAFLEIVFEDDGPGIAPQDLDRVFDPFFTTKDVGEGNGLGLAVTYGIVRDHGGRIRVESEHGRFTRFVLHLPCSAPRTGVEPGAADER